MPQIRLGMAVATIFASAVAGCATAPRWIHARSGVAPSTALADYRQCRDLREQVGRHVEATTRSQLSAGDAVQPNAESIARMAARDAEDHAFDVCLRSRGYAPRDLTQEEYVRFYVGVEHDLETLAYIMAGASAEEYKRNRSRQKVYR